MTQAAKAGLEGEILRRVLMWSAIALLLLAPAVAMQFTHEVNWTALDFAVAALLLGGAGAVYEATTLFVRRPGMRLVIAGALLLAVLVAWAQGAVGIL